MLLATTLFRLSLNVAAGILVTRSAGTGDFGADLKAQFFMRSRALWVAAGILFLFAMIPGLPTFSFLFLAVALAVIAYRVQKAEMVRELPAALPELPVRPASEEITRRCSRSICSSWRSATV